ncbi:hypothetical protein QUF07_00690 [Lentilactobacillus sp. TOM.63]|uniref:hypothetical protein n=1 Tax=Lentilactobacillus sp. TOM.63 TaxID=3055077 RepID=UPI000ABDDFED|nr:hypothetical protein [Lentilactobacillus sp. TOM.63]MDM7515226.1 hypothetical protein [Lentilactobacillus sp. TOM.63]
MRGFFYKKQATIEDVGELEGLLKQRKKELGGRFMADCSAIPLLTGDMVTTLK